MKGHVHARYVPSAGETRSGGLVHEWDVGYSRHAARSACGALTVLEKRLELTDEPVTCEACRREDGQ